MMPEGILIRKILKMIAEAYHIDQLTLRTGKCRYPDTEARYMAFFLLDRYVFRHQALAARHRSIAAQFGLSPKSVAYGLHKVAFQWLAKNGPFRQKLYVIEKKLNYDNGKPIA